MGVDGTIKKHLRMQMQDLEYYKLRLKYIFTERYKETAVRTKFLSMLVPDVASFLSSYKDIFLHDVYKFSSVNASPKILDCGANVGVSVLYFKKIFPSARIVAFEPDPNIFFYLEKNIASAKLSDVELLNKAVWTSETTLSFWSEGADAGRIDSGKDSNIRISTVKLSDYLQEGEVDFLKMDIEGAEVEVLKSCSGDLKNIKYCFVEFHSFPSKKQELGVLIDIFERQGFRLHIHPVMVQASPFVQIHANVENMDMQLNLFFYRN